MSAAWLAHALVVGTLLAVAASALERALVMGGRPVRWVWVAALAGVLALVGTSPLRQSAPLGPVAVPHLNPNSPGSWDRGASGVGFSLAGTIADITDAAWSALRAPIEAASRVGARVDTPAVRRAFLTFWALVSGSLLALFTLTLARYRRVRRGWPLVELAGERVRISPGEGPALVGLFRPEIVVPSWLLGADPTRQSLVVTHEREHARAGDHLLLALGGVILALLPWHPAVWWMHGRLRAAVEMDCDLRVLRLGGPKGVYGALLLDMAGRRVRLPLGASALAGTPTHIERRIRAMTQKRPRHAAQRGAALAAVASLLVVLACGAELPTSAEIEGMDVAAVEATMEARGVYPFVGAVRYVVDGVDVAPEAARALAPDRIARVEVRKSGEHEGSHLIQITTVAAGADASGHVVEAREREVPMVITSGEGGGRVVLRARADTNEIPLTTSSSFDGLLIVNGEPVGREVLGRLRPGDIESIEVVKGAAAAQTYSDPAARNGVIRVTLKPGVTVR